MADPKENDIIIKTLTKAVVEENKLGLLLQDLIRRTGLNREKLLRELDDKVKDNIISANIIAGGGKKNIVLYYLPFILDLAKKRIKELEQK